MRAVLLNHLAHTRPLIIAGPCSIESKEQLFATTQALAATGLVHALRAGVWKPRTQPDCFSGLGEEALAWIRELKAKYALPVLVEVANAAQANKALQAGVDGLWIGARTTTNPFALDELFAYIAKFDATIPVLIKNPLAPDLKLWIGAVLRAEKAGLLKLALVHRGCACYPNYANLRSEPHWELARAMRQAYPKLPMLLDPSHLAGTRELLLPIILASQDLALDGLIIESHINPEQALTDKAQQVHPEQLCRILEGYFQAEQNVLSANMLANYRDLIDVLDQRLLQLLLARMQVVEKIAHVKQHLDLPLLQQERYANMRKQWQQLAQGENLQNQNLQSQFLQDLFELIHNESLRRQQLQLNKSAYSSE